MMDEDIYDSLSYVMPHLRHGLWHFTSLDNFRSIVASGSLDPNRGQFPYNHGQTKYYYGGQHEYLSLFDFETANESEYREIASTWAPFITEFKPYTVGIKIKRDLVTELIPNDWDNRRHNANFIPFVECWSVHAIPVEAFEKILITTWFTDVDRALIVYEAPFQIAILNDIDEALDRKLSPEEIVKIRQSLADFLGVPIEEIP